MTRFFQTNNRLLKVALFSLSFLLMTSILPLAAADSPAESGGGIEKFSFFTRPDPEGTPTPIQVAVIILDLPEISDVAETFRIDFYFVVRWRDSRLARTAGDPVQFKNLDEIWHPFVDITNTRDLDERYQNRLQVDRKGNVQFMQRYTGTLSTPLELRDFPFDHQELEITIVSARYGPEEVVFDRDRATFSQLGDLSPTGWEAVLLEPEAGIQSFPALNRTLSRIDFPIEVKRHIRFYSLKIIIPLLLIIFMAWTVFWIDPSLIATQIGIATASVFSLILFNHRVAGLLPRVSYITRLDFLLLGGTIIVFVALGETVLTSRLAKTGKEELGRSIDRWARWVYLALVILLVGWTLIG